MLSLARVSRRSSAAIALLAIAGCSSVQPRSETSASPSQKLSDRERITHLLSRLTFGERSGDAERVAAMGIDTWIDRQLHPESIVDTAVVTALAPIPAWSEPTSNVAALTGGPKPAAAVQFAVPKLVPTGNPTADSLARAMAAAQLKLRALLVGAPNDLFYAGKVVRAQLSERQLLEVVTDFWENHFSVYSGKMPSREALIVWDRDVLRPHALGKFRDLLGAVAHSPAMLYYLDNQLSTRRGLNENYARELMELHTLGVDGGYTQHDVIEVARALTGWTISGAPNPTVFRFRPEMHDTGSKVVLGHPLAPGRGMEDGEEVLDIIARHPSTARHIAFKLVRRLVSDDPPPALVQRAAATFTKTDGDIAEVVRTIVRSPEFFSRAAFRAKVKTPFVLVVSARRTLDAPADTTPATARLIAQLGQPTFGWLTPDGWPETGDAWINAGTIFKRLKYARDLASGSAALTPVDRWHGWRALAALPLEGQVHGVVRDVLGGCAESNTREVMLMPFDAPALQSRAPPSRDATEGQRRLRELLTIALASPEFQRR